MLEPISIAITVAAALAGFATGYAARSFLSYRRRRFAKSKRLSQA